jgi:hypothetical protein
MEALDDETQDERQLPLATERLLPRSFVWKPSVMAMFAAVGVPQPGERLLVHANIQKERQTSSYDHLLLTSERLLILTFVWHRFRYRLTEFPRESLRLFVAGRAGKSWILAAGPGRVITFRAYSGSREARRTGWITLLGKFVGL